MSVRSLIGACALCAVAAVDLRAQDGKTLDVVQILLRWEQASAQAPRAAADREFSEYSDRLSAHAIEAAGALCGPVSARGLIRQYQWTARTDESGQLILTAVPRDELGRLFFRAVEVEFLSGEWRPRELRLHDPDDRQPSVAIRIPVTSPADRGVDLVQTAGSGIVPTLPVSLEEETVTQAEPELDTVLAAWAAATRRVERAEIEFQRYTYDLSTGIEERGTGRLRYEGPHRGSYELRPAAVPGASARTDRRGRPLTVEAARGVVYSWNDNLLVVARPEERTYKQLSIPRSAGSIQLAGTAHRQWYALSAPHRALPATVDVHSESFIDRFEWSILNRDQGRLILQGWPVGEGDQQAISVLQVVLDSQTFFAQATRLVSADNHVETVHVLKRIRLNDEAPADEWRPDLSGYTREDPAPVAPPAELEPGLLEATAE